MPLDLRDLLQGLTIKHICYTLVVDGEEIVWDVTEATRAAMQGRFGEPLTLTMDPIWADHTKGYLDLQKIENIKKDRMRLDLPAIAIEAHDSTRKRLVLMCFIDGNHRLTARWELGLPDFKTWVIPKDIERVFRIPRDEIVRTFDMPKEPPK